MIATPSGRPVSFFFQRRRRRSQAATNPNISPATAQPTAAPAMAPVETPDEGTDWTIVGVVSEAAAPPVDVVCELERIELEAVAVICLVLVISIVVSIVVNTVSPPGANTKVIQDTADIPLVVVYPWHWYAVDNVVVNAAILRQERMIRAE